VKAQRLRIRYRVTGVACTVSARDLVAAWETAVRNAGFALAYSEGRRPSPQIALAAPLPLGVTSDCEIVDICLEEPADPDTVLSEIRAGLPGGIEPLAVEQAGVDDASLQSQLRRAEYRVKLHPPCPAAEELNRRSAAILASNNLPSEYVRTNKVRVYDLRPLILSLDAATEGESTVVRMRLRAEQENTARADQVLLALGVECEARIHRTRLELDDVPAILQAYRRAGEPTGEDLQ
jgi:radical SAM-linked protein